jgi:O-antigen/teichoic acid export membrane protein
MAGARLQDNVGASLTGRAVSAAKWNYAGNIARALVQFFMGIVLARLLGPASFGVVAIAWLVLGIGKLVADFGFGAALVQRDELTIRDVQFAFTVQLLLGFGLALVGFSTAPLIARYFSEPQAMPVIRAMSGLFILQAVAQTATSLLSRNLQFKSIQLTSVAAYLIGYVGVGLPVALMGGGVWSLVAAQGTQVASYSFMVVWLSGLRIQLSIRPESAGLFGFGARVISANLASWVVLNLDSVVVGRAFGAAELGLYNRAMTLVSTPAATLTTSIQSVLFAVCSRAQNNLPRIRAAYLGGTALLALATFPIFITLSAVAETAIAAVYGGAWTGAAALLRPLALAMPLHATLAIAGPVLMALNRTDLEVRAQWITVVAMLPLLGLASTYSLHAVAWVVPGIYLIRLLLLVCAVQAAVRFTSFEWMKAFVPALLVSVAVVVPAWLVDRFAGLHSPGARLLFDAATAGGVSLLVLRILGRQIARSAAGELLSGSLRGPRFVVAWLRLQ